MRDHEVPTHVGAEDKALLFLTFPQVAAMLAVFGMGYGVWRFTPFGPSELRLGLAAVVALIGVAATIGQIGGRRLPLVAADLLKYRLTPRRYEGAVLELVRAEPPAPVERPQSRLALLASAAKRRAARRKRSNNNSKENKEKRKMKSERRAFRPHMWFGKRRRHAVEGRKAGKGRHAILGIALLAVLAAGLVFAQSTSADGPDEEEEWHWLSEVEFRPPEPVLGRRLFVEELTVRSDRAYVTLRAATDLQLRVRAYGGPGGRSYLFFGVASLDEGESIDYSLPLNGEAPSLVFSWIDSLDQAGTVTFKGEQLPHPLPSADGRLCTLTVDSITWTPGEMSGVVGSSCVASVEEPFDIETSSGHHGQTVKALLDAELTDITGTVSVTVGDAHTSAALIPNGDTPFSVDITDEQTIRHVGFGAMLTATVEAETPPVVELTHHEEWVEEVSVLRPGTGEWVSKTVTHDHGTATSTTHTISAYLSIPSETISLDVTVEVVHEEHVTAEVGESGTATATLSEEYELALTIGSDAPYEALVLPEKEEPDKAEQRPLTPDEFDDLFGWEYPH